MAILRGHHHKYWYHAIQQTYQKCAQPPGTKREKVLKDQSPLEFCATLAREVWRFFEKIQEKRNDCLRNLSGDPLSCFDAQLNERLIHYKKNKAAMLDYFDRHWIEHLEYVIRGWSYKRKRQLLRVLDGWHSKHKAETTAATMNQKSLLGFADFTVSHPPEQM